MVETFILTVPLKSNEKCSLARHFHAQAAKDLIRLFEYYAKKHPQRFVWLDQKNLPAMILAMTKGERAYGQSILEKHIELFRNLGVLTALVKGEKYSRSKDWGVQVLRHDDLARRVESGCEWIGLNMPPEFYVSRDDPEPPLINPKRRIKQVRDPIAVEQARWKKRKALDDAPLPVTFHTPPNCPCPECQAHRARNLTMRKSGGESTGYRRKSGDESTGYRRKSGGESTGDRAPNASAKKTAKKSLQRKSGGDRAPSTLNLLNHSKHLLNNWNDATHAASASQPISSLYATKSDDEKRKRITNLRERIKYFGEADDWLREIEELEKLLGGRK